MSALFCCEAIKPYKSQRLDHEMKFSTFMRWAESTKAASQTSHSIDETNGWVLAYAVQLVRQVNFGPLESKRYFVCLSGHQELFVEVSEEYLIQGNFQKLNSYAMSFLFQGHDIKTGHSPNTMNFSYKNFRCDQHNRFFEVNIYQKDPINKHHWRANLARPSSAIDL